MAAVWLWSVDEAATVASGVLAVCCKDFRVLHFDFGARTSAAERWATALRHLCFAVSPSTAPAMGREGGGGPPVLCWSRELERQGVDWDRWRLTDANATFGLCPSYPSVFAVPAATTDEVLAAAALFRSSSRLPALSWYHAPSGATITRASQPMVGLFSSRSAADEQLVEYIRLANNGAKQLNIMDCRSRLSAYANKVAKGAGTESVQHYTNCTLDFVGVENIHAMRESLHELYLACSRPSSSSWLSWLSHLELLLAASFAVAKMVAKDGLSVLIHCSDGWDRTAQLSSLAQLLLDPYYRTLEGFPVLVEKEWLAFGHKFYDRCGHGQSAFWDEHERSPIFLQFLDCVHQLTEQYPSAFEFTTAYLERIVDELYACRHAEFLHNCEREREASQVRSRAPSLWASLAEPHVRAAYANPFFTASAVQAVPLEPDCSPGALRLWAGLYCRWRGAVHRDTAAVQEFVRSKVEEMRAQQSMLESTLEHLNRRLEGVMAELALRADPRCPAPSAVATAIEPQDVQRQGQSPPAVGPLGRAAIIDDYRAPAATPVQLLPPLPPPGPAWSAVLSEFAQSLCDTIRAYSSPQASTAQEYARLCREHSQHSGSCGDDDEALEKEWQQQQIELERQRQRQQRWEQ